MYIFSRLVWHARLAMGASTLSQELVRVVTLASMKITNGLLLQGLYNNPHIPQTPTTIQEWQIQHLSIEMVLILEFVQFNT